MTIDFTLELIIRAMPYSWASV